MQCKWSKVPPRQLAYKMNDDTKSIYSDRNLVMPLLSPASRYHYLFLNRFLCQSAIRIILILRLRKSRHANLCSKNQFFRQNVVVIAISELRPGSNERYEKSTFYGPFRFLIFILIFNKKNL